MAILERHAANPILTRESIPAGSPLADPSSVFNPGAVHHDGLYQLLLRVQTRARRTAWLRATSLDGIAFDVHPEPAELRGLDRIPGAVHHVYDPRITRVNDRLFVLAAIDLDTECRLGLFETADLQRFEFRGLCSDEENRNGVLFPERIGGRYARLDRPNRVHRADRPPTGDAIRLSFSDDLLVWEPAAIVAEGRPRLWDELIGPGPPPLLTSHGWLVLYHGIATHPGALNIYQAGVLLLDATDPSRVVGRADANVLEPRMPYEIAGQVPNVVFPSGWVASPEPRPDPGAATASDDARVHVYYGAADTCVALATARVGDLVEACR
jgi:beta-1,4-mannooligosaccharide/beta-1,4-mannosyl-N-acetylglucosamine phosphorylase